MTGSPPELRKNAIGMWQIVFFVIAAAAPLTGMLGIIPVDIRLGNGAGVPGAFVMSGSEDGLVRSFPWIMLAVLLLGMGISVGLSRLGVRVRLDQVADEV
jgi:hypothetical protein